MLAVGLYVLPLLSDMTLELGGPVQVLLPITLVSALAATSYGLLVATFARTPEQAAAIGATSVIVLAVLGGIMVPTFVMPEALQTLARCSPLYWGHKAYLDYFVHGAGLAEVAGSLGVLVAFALSCLALAAPRLARATP
jgi:ABC-2 type transport system permease protein